jgi:hypothetical protein
MQRLLCLCGLAAALILSTPAPAAQAPSADDIIAHHLEALGGLDKLKAIKTLKRSGRLIVPGFNGELVYTETRMRPDAIRQDLTLQGLTQVAAFDGREGWQIEPFQGRKDPSRMSADETKAMRLAADIDRPLIDYKAKGHRVEYLGLEDVDGTPAYKLRVKLAWGDEVTYWIDPDTWMLVRDRERQTVRGAEQVVDTDYGEYEQVGGVFVPMEEEQGPQDSDPSQKQKIVFDKAEANVPVERTLFSFPPTAKSAAQEHR